MGSDSHGDPIQVRQELSFRCERTGGRRAKANVPLGLRVGVGCTGLLGGWRGYGEEQARGQELGLWRIGEEVALPWGRLLTQAQGRLGWRWEF